MTEILNKGLFELGTGGVGINLRPLERSLTSSFARTWLERFLISFVLHSSVMGQ